ncbi:MAG: AAA family ATPase [Rhizobiaceae bacterium]|nr:AAA family ATPase [Rhizobiaceae bacterium]
MNAINTIPRLAHALALARKGFKVFPLSPNSKAPPKDFAWKDVATTDTAQISDWWQREPFYNIGVACGNGLLVVDVDVKNGKPGLASLDLLEVAGLPQSFRVKTPSGGRHIYVNVEHDYRNRVDLPGFEGIDLKSTGGYVVGPGSEFDGRKYEIIGGEIEPAGGAFEDFLQRIAPRRRKATVASPLLELDLPEYVKRAEHYLREQAPEAIEGEGGDETTYRIAARLRDFGISEPTALELLLDHWNEQKARPPWMPDELSLKVENAFRYGTRAWGAATALAEFEPLDIDVGESPVTRQVAEAAIERARQAVKPERRRFRAVPFGDAVRAALEDAGDPLIDGIIDCGAIATIFGPSNSGKTFVALDLADAIASGFRWNGHEVCHGGVLYVAAEGGHGIFKRVAALAKRRHRPVETPLHIMPFPVNLFEPEADSPSVIAETKWLERESGLPARLIVVDTLARALAGGDENSGKDMGALIRNIDRIRDETGAAVLIIHHTGKDAARGARGHSSLVAAVDTELEVVREKDAAFATLRCTKQRDMEKFTDIRFALESVTVGETPRGRPVRSCVVRWLNGSELEAIPLSQGEQAMLDSLRGLCKPATGPEWDDAHRRNMSPSWQPGDSFPEGCSGQNLRKLRKSIREAGHVRELPGDLFEPVDIE